MRIQFITYHRTAPQPDREDVHVLTFDQFAHHVELIRQAGVTVASARVLANGADVEGYQLGITFDDGFKSDLVNAEVLARHGMTAMFFISTANIGREGYLDEDDIRRLRDMGMRIGSHSHRHVRLNTLPETESREQLVHSKQRLEAILHEAVDCLAFPGGGYDARVAAMSKEAGYRHLMTTGWGVNQIAGKSSGLYRRNNILAGMTDQVFTDLVTLKSLRRRRLEYLAKQGLRALLPEKGYGALRRLILRGNG